MFEKQKFVVGEVCCLQEIVESFLRVKSNLCYKMLKTHVDKSKLPFTCDARLIADTILKNLVIQHSDTPPISNVIKDHHNCKEKKIKDFRLFCVYVLYDNSTFCTHSHKKLLNET